MLQGYSRKGKNVIKINSHVAKFVHQSFSAVQTSHINSTVTFALSVSSVLIELNVGNVTYVQAATRVD